MRDSLGLTSLRTVWSRSKSTKNKTCLVKVYTSLSKKSTRSKSTHLSQKSLPSMQPQNCLANMRRQSATLMFLKPWLGSLAKNISARYRRKNDRMGILHLSNINKTDIDHTAFSLLLGCVFWKYGFPQNRLQRLWFSCASLPAAGVSSQAAGTCGEVQRLGTSSHGSIIP